MSPSWIVVACLVLIEICGFELVESKPISPFVPQSNKSSGDHNNEILSHSIINRSKRQVGEPPSSYFSRSSSGSSDPAPFIPKIAPPPAGSILTYDGKPISASIGAFSIVPKSERRTPSINLNRPQYATFRGDHPSPIPDIVPRDFPQFKDNRGIVSDFPPRFN